MKKYNRALIGYHMVYGVYMQQNSTREGTISFFSVLTSSQCMKLLKLLKEDVCTASSLSIAMDVSRPTISYYLKRLATNGFIEIFMDLNDLRVKQIRMTTRGRNAIRLVDNYAIIIDTMDNIKEQKNILDPC